MEQQGRSRGAHVAAVADLLRQRVGGGNLGLRDRRSIVQGRNVLFNAFGGKVPVRCAPVKPCEKPYLIARIGLNRQVLLDAAGAAICLQNGSGGRILEYPQEEGTSSSSVK